MPELPTLSTKPSVPIINDTGSDIEKCDPEKEFDQDETCLCPPSSVTNFGGGAYDEYSAEVNQNALIVRVAKDSRMVTQIFENDDDDSADEHVCSSSKSKKLKLQCQDDGDNVSDNILR